MKGAPGGGGEDAWDWGVACGGGSRERRQQRPRGAAAPPRLPACPRGEAWGHHPLPRRRVTVGSPPFPLQVEPPELPEDLQHWIAYNEASSRLLRAESGLGHAAKEQ